MLPTCVRILFTYGVDANPFITGKGAGDDDNDTPSTPEAHSSGGSTTIDNMLETIANEGDQEEEGELPPADEAKKATTQGNTSTDRDSDISAEEVIIGAHTAIIANKQTKAKGDTESKDAQQEGMCMIAIESRLNYDYFK